MKKSLIEHLRCPVTGKPLTLWESREEIGDEGVEGALAEEGSGRTYEIHGGTPVLLPRGRRAVDDLATLLALGAEAHGFAEAARMLADGELVFPVEESYGQAVTGVEQREGQERASEAFWETFSRNRLVQQQIVAMDQHWDAVEEMWLRAEINFADSILDVGTGWGGTFQRLLEYGPQDALVVGLDTAYLNLQVARGRAERTGFEHAALVVGDVTEPPFRAGMFESVVSWFGLGTIPLFRDGLHAIHDLLGPGFPFACAWTPTLLADMEGLAGPDVLARMAARLDIPQSPEAAGDTARMVGFEEVEVVEMGPIYVLSGRVAR